MPKLCPIYILIRIALGIFTNAIQYGFPAECVTFSILIKKGGVIISDDNNR